jgi:hypothetical protein
MPRLLLWIPFCFFHGIPSMATEAAAAASNMKFESSDERLVQTFEWAKSRALLYAHDGSDPVGPWYEAALPGRSAFCMRDVAHQASGAASLGLDEANTNMLRRFAAAVSASRDWAGYWEIDVTGRPAPVDYTSDQDFWYNLPANFDVLDAVYRMWMWTGDSTYLTAPEFTRFFHTTASQYVKTWGLEPRHILKRPRIMNRHLAVGRDIDSRGIPSYAEGHKDFNVGVDLLAAEYRAFMDLAILAKRRHNSNLFIGYRSSARSLGELIQKYAWSPVEHHFHGSLTQSYMGAASGDAFVLWFKATNDPGQIRGALEYLTSTAYLSHVNIEEESYLPRILFFYGLRGAAYERIIALSSPDKERRDYPEVSFAVVDAIVSGLMGIDVERAGENAPPTISTLSGLPDDRGYARVSSVHIQGGTIDVSHKGYRQSSLWNGTDKTVRWLAQFPGRFDRLSVKGEVTPAVLRTDWAGDAVGSVAIEVAPRTEAIVTIP